MTVKELQKFFEEHLVPSRLYNMKGGHHRNRICIARDKKRKGWEVYFSEGKSKIGLMHFASESEACQRMKDEVRKVMEQLYGLSWKGFAWQTVLTGIRFHLKSFYIYTGLAKGGMYLQASGSIRRTFTPGGAGKLLHAGLSRTQKGLLHSWA